MRPLRICAVLAVALVTGETPAVASARVELFSPFVTNTIGYPTPLYKPSQVPLSEDGSLFVTGIKWTDWGTHRAVGIGTAHYNYCRPDCSLNTYSRHPARLLATNPGLEIGCPPNEAPDYYHHLEVTVPALKARSRYLRINNWATKPEDEC